jgi:hypothetical protein
MYRSMAGDPDPEKQQTVENGSWKLQAPEFSTGFFVYLGFVLLVLTIVNSLLYKFVFNPPREERREALSSTGPIRPRFRVTSREQEKEAREAREAKKAQEAIAAQSREAPVPSE